MKRFLICTFALAALAACDKEPAGVVNTESGDVYMQFSIKMETTRSKTDESGDTNSNADPDFEVGKDYENKVSSVDIVLMNADNTVAARAADVTLTSAATDTYVASFQSVALQEDTEYYVYIVVNGVYESIDEVRTIDADNLTAEGGIAEQNKFLMSNANEKQYNITKTPADLNLYNTPQNPFNLGAFEVERAAARFDYKAVKTDNVYALSENAENVATVNVQLTDAALVNLSKSFYTYRRVSNDGTATGAVVGGVETPNNYVVDTDYQAKSGAAAMASDALTALSVNNFLYSSTAPATWKWSSLTLDTDDNWAGADGNDGYKIWRYATENTIPAGVDNQKHAISTGVVFKGKLVATDAASAELKAAMAAGDRIFLFKEQLIGNWDAVAAAATKSATNANPDPELAAAYNSVVAADVAGTEEFDAPASAYAAAGFTAYVANSEGVYEAIYYYWNRHNDNGDNTLMGKMEFDVVRNNVYKLAVTNINKYGHPYLDPDKTPENPDVPIDPDPEDPTDPDEEKNYYFTVTVKVLPWVVRINNIEF